MHLSLMWKYLNSYQRMLKLEGPTVNFGDERILIAINGHI